MSLGDCVWYLRAGDSEEKSRWVEAVEMTKVSFISRDFVFIYLRRCSRLFLMSAKQIARFIDQFLSLKIVLVVGGQARPFSIVYSNKATIFF